MITLYQLHWSHFVEKVRWALDYKGLEWTAVDVDPFTKRQLVQLQCPLTLDSGHKLYAVPTIHDAATGSGGHGFNQKSWITWRKPIQLPRCIL